MPGATGLRLTYMPVGKPSLLKGRWQASFKCFVLSQKKQTQEIVYKVHKASHLKASLSGFGGRSAGDTGSSCPKPL